MENVHSDDRMKKVDGHNFVPRGFSVFKMAVFLKIRGAWEQRFVARDERDFWKIKCFPRFTKGYSLSIAFERLFLVFDRLKMIQCTF